LLARVPRLAERRDPEQSQLLGTVPGAPDVFASGTAARSPSVAPPAPSVSERARPTAAGAGLGRAEAGVFRLGGDTLQRAQ